MRFNSQNEEIKLNYGINDDSLSHNYDLPWEYSFIKLNFNLIFFFNWQNWASMDKAINMRTNVLWHCSS